MQPTSAPGALVAADKSMIRIHRPRAFQGCGMYTGVWDSGHFVADLGNGHSVAYSCEPGTHYFINRSVERVGVVEGQLLPSQTYDLWVDTAGAFVASFQLEPVNRSSKQWDKVPKWVAENKWMERAATAAEYEAQHQNDVKIILKDFVGGDKKDRLRQLGPDDHR